MALTNLFAPKQLNILRIAKKNSDWRMMILYGAKRSGKTFVNNFIFIKELRRVAKLAKAQGNLMPKYILAGASDKTITNNVISEVEDLFGITFKPDRNNNLHIQFPGLPDVTIVKAPTGNISGLKSIRGMTSFGAYINEASLANPYVFKEIRDRCSMPNSRVIVDTNPDSPTHWLKTDYIDSDAKQIISVHFVLDDNTHLSPDYIANIKATTASGMLYDRDVLGEWVSAEGLVYSDFTQKNNLLTRQQYERRYSKLDRLNARKIAGVDWGFEHKGVIVVIALMPNGDQVLIEEHTHKHLQGTDWLKIARDIKARYGNIPFYCDSARPEYVSLFRAGQINALNADKSIMAGVAYVSGLIKAGKFQAITDAIKYFEKEVFDYVWDEKSGLPLKADGNDDVVDAIRYAIYSEHAKQEKLKHLAKNPTLQSQINVAINHGLIN